LFHRLSIGAPGAETSAAHRRRAAARCTRRRRENTIGDVASNGCLFQDRLGKNSTHEKFQEPTISRPTYRRWMNVVGMARDVDLARSHSCANNYLLLWQSCCMIFKKVVLQLCLY